MRKPFVVPVANSVVRTKGFRRKTPSTESGIHFPGLWPFSLCCFMTVRAATSLALLL